MAVLVGKAPGESLLPPFTLEDFTLPPDLPLLVPSELVRTRPDILGAEALLHISNAEYGVAISKLYPQINLSADLGSQALTTGALFGSGSSLEFSGTADNCSIQPARRKESAGRLRCGCGKLPIRRFRSSAT